MTPHGFIQQVQYHALSAGVGAITQATFNGRVDFNQLAKGFAAGVAGGTIANQIGKLYDFGSPNAEINYFVHKALHGLGGAAMGAILDGERGMLPGAFDSMVSKVVSEAMFDYNDLMILKAKGDNCTINNKMQLSYDVARIVSAIGAMALNLDVNLTVIAATNALDNNGWRTWVRKLGVNIDLAHEVIDEDQLENIIKEENLSPEQVELFKAKFSDIYATLIQDSETTSQWAAISQEPDFARKADKALEIFILKTTDYHMATKRLLNEFPWAKTLVQGSLEACMFTMRAMMYVDISLAGAATGASIGAMAGPQGSSIGALVGSAGAFAGIYAILEPALAKALESGVQFLQDKASSYGKSEQHKQAIKEAVSDICVAFGTVLGAKYIKSAGERLPSTINTIKAQQYQAAWMAGVDKLLSHRAITRNPRLG